MNAQVSGFLIEHKAAIDFTLQVVSGEIGIFVRPLAVMNPIKNKKLVSGFNVIFERDFVAVNRAEIIAHASAAPADARRPCAPENEGNNRGNDDNAPQPSRMFANCSDHSGKKGTQSLTGAGEDGKRKFEGFGSGSWGPGLCDFTPDTIPYFSHLAASVAA